MKTSEKEGAGYRAMPVKHFTKLSQSSGWEGERGMWTNLDIVGSRPNLTESEEAVE